MLEASGATSSALRLAEEYESAFGRPALIEIVRQETSDDDFDPSDLHEKLVDLPWADVFTTNYDRLIERAALNSPGRSMRRFSYEVVTQAADIPLARRPRIVKLHGTLPDLANLVLTEEDFRCYGDRQAAFVNAVRASMSENAFCLLGFSGDDPNFLAWSGWIRDTLRESTPTVYLFCTEPPAPFKRKLLEQRNVVPIPLSVIFNTKDVGLAIDRLLNFLHEDSSLAFVDWNRPPDDVSLKSKQDEDKQEPFDADKLGWVETALIWRRNRLEYQGWEVLHRSSLSYLWGGTEFAYRDFSAQSIKDLRVHEKLLVTREMLWRLSMCLAPIEDDRVETIIDPLVEAIESDLKKILQPERLHFGKNEVVVTQPELLEAYRYLLCQLIRHSRETGDRKKFDRLSVSLHQAPNVTAEEICFAVHQDILFELGSLDADAVRHRLRDWNVDGLPAVWTVRKCGLLMEIGEITRASDDLLDLIDSLFSTKVEPEIDYLRRSVEGIALYQMELMNWWNRSNSWHTRSRKTANELGESSHRQPDEFEVGETISTVGNAKSSKQPQPDSGDKRSPDDET
ncbi:MAG: SIR2 family protein, partial [Rubripirellula sp.]